jgi:WD40 repeat protein
VSKNGQLVAAGGLDQTVRVYNFADGKLLSQFKAPGVVRGLAFSPNNATLGAAVENNSIQTWNVLQTPGQPLPAEFGKPLQTYSHGGPVAEVVFGPDSSLLYSASADKTVKVWKSASETPVKNFPHPNLVDAVAFSPVGGLLATGCHDGKLRLFDVAKGQVVREINAHALPMPSPIYSVQWSHDGKQIFSASFDHSVKQWDAASGNLVREFKGYKEKDFEKGHRDAVFCVALSPDGKTLATGSSDKTVKLWNVADGSVVRDLVNPDLKAPPAGLPPLAAPGWIYGVRFTADSKLIAAGGGTKGRGYMAMWNVADGKLLSTEELQLGPFFSLALSGDGKALAVGTGHSVPSGGAPEAGGQQLNLSYVLKVPAGK